MKEAKPSPRLLLAEAKRTEARERLLGRADELKTRLSPGALADEMMNGLADRATELAGKRPMTFLAAAGALGLVVLRRPVARWLSRRRR
ncbi:hypothetical protein LZK98_11250 [Sphingomonas cannabina]|uniref:hypothetical protein n=1 Tax=Sphingomonas cannabina TaxID=2899123 RepID=UPI001F479E49|nr:hypothetical protein [Sphingomonas cannabina]UIJ43667.1 hypothetical protein LZK98_11250 [Sphingomonas cannabina]